MRNSSQGVKLDKCVEMAEALGKFKDHRDVKCLKVADVAAEGKAARPGEHNPRRDASAHKET